MKYPLVMAITGASGVVYSIRLLERLLQSGCEVHLTITPSAKKVLELELGIAIDLRGFVCQDLARSHRPGVPSGTTDMDRAIAGFLRGLHALLDSPSGAGGDSGAAARRVGSICYHHYEDFTAPIASGSFLTGGMVVCPCSGSTLSAVAHGGSSNLVTRAADIHLKEGRKLVLVPRETPLSSIQLDNMKRAAQSGAVVLPAAPGWYHGVESIGDVIDFVVARVLDQLGIAHALMRRWGEA